MSKEKVIEQAEKFLKEGKYDRAIKEYEKLLAEEPSDMRAKLKVADILTRKKDIPTALKMYREVAEAYEKENFHLKAIAVYKSILKLAPTTIEANEKLGNLYCKVGLDRDALHQYQIVANYYDGKGMSREALEIRKKIVEIDPSNTTGRIRLAEMMQAEGKAEDSIREYEHAAEILSSKNDRESLIEVYEKILYFRPQNVDMLVKLCQIYFDKRDFKKALRRIESSPVLVKEDTSVGELWAEALLEDHQVDASRRKFRELYSTALEKKDAEKIARLYSRILQEFSDDQDYLDNLEEIRKTAGMSAEPAKPHFRQDFEKTDMIDLNRLDELKKK